MARRTLFASLTEGDWEATREAMFGQKNKPLVVNEVYSRCERIFTTGF
jgi:hypothetical protein